MGWRGGQKQITALGLAAFLFAVGMLFIPSRLFVGDPYAWREEAISLVLRHRLEIPAKIALAHGEKFQYFTQNQRTGEWYSKYGFRGKPARALV